MLSPLEMLCGTFPVGRFPLPAEPPHWKSGQPGTPYQKQLFQGVKPQKKCSKNLFAGSVIKRIGSKRPFQPSAVVRGTPIWGCHHQLDDQYKNPNMNNKDHLVGRLTRSIPSLCIALQSLPSFDCRSTF